MKPSVLPVIHYESDKQCMENAELVFSAGCEGVFLIHMNGDNHKLLKVAEDIKIEWPDRLLGINYLGYTAEKALHFNTKLDVDMTWTDEQLTHSLNKPWDEAKRVKKFLAKSPRHLFFIAVAFKYQIKEDHPGYSACMARDMGFIPTTSGTGTGVAADINKIKRMKEDLGSNGSLAIASGITPENVGDFAPYLSHILVSTGISRDFHNFDADKLRSLMDAIG